MYNTCVVTTDQKNLLLGAARDSVTDVVLGRPLRGADLRLTGVQNGGAFVTLRRRGALRGCMGSFDPDPDLVKTVQEAAAAAARDPRFLSNPITGPELTMIQIEISILSTPHPTTAPLKLEIGRHGILIDNPRGRGCFLPHVATEFGWSPEQFLDHCCRDKANLESDAWRNADTTVSLFTAEVFSEAADTRIGVSVSDQ